MNYIIEIWLDDPKNYYKYRSFLLRDRITNEVRVFTTPEKGDEAVEEWARLSCVPKTEYEVWHLKLGEVE